MAKEPDHPHGGPPGQTGQNPGQGGAPPPGQSKPAPAPTDAEADAARDAAREKRAEEMRAKAAEPEPAEVTEARKAGTIGAQVVLDPESDASIAAKGGAGDTIEENTIARDTALAKEGLNPADPNANVTDDQVARQQKAADVYLGAPAA